MARKTIKICPVCGKEFQGTDGKKTCSNACRTAAVRFRQKGRKMEYSLLAKTKGQKLPSAKQATAAPQSPTPVTLSNAPLKLESGSKEAISAHQTVPAMTMDQKWSHNERINKLITEKRKEKMPPGMLPKRWGLYQSDAIQELEKQLIQ